MKFFPYTSKIIQFSAQIVVNARTYLALYNQHKMSSVEFLSFFESRKTFFLDFENPL